MSSVRKRCQSFMETPVPPTHTPWGYTSDRRRQCGVFHYRFYNGWDVIRKTLMNLASDLKISTMPTHPASLLSSSATTASRRVADGAGGSSSTYGEICLLAPGHVPRGRLSSSVGRGFNHGMKMKTDLPTRMSYYKEGCVLAIFQAPNNCCIFNGGRTLLGEPSSRRPMN